VDSLRFVICVRPDCRHVFYLCRVCDRGDRYCSRAYAQRARRATLHDAGRRYQHRWRGRLHHAARQARYRARHETVTHQTSPSVTPSGIVLVPPASPSSGGQEDTDDAEVDRAIPPAGPRCTRCGRPGRFLRQVPSPTCARPAPRRGAEGRR
jgi:hypothetical protein